MGGPVWGAYLFRNSENARPRGNRPGTMLQMQRLGFHDRHIRFAGDREKIIGRAAAHQAGCSVVIGQCNLVQCSSIEVQWSNTSTNKCARFDGCSAK